MIRPILYVISVVLLATGIPVATYAQLDVLIARVKPAVVYIEAETLLGSVVSGSGFIYDASGYILTNHHVIEGATRISVALSDRRTYPATVVDYAHTEEIGENGQWEDTPDVAVLKVDASDLPTIPLGISADLRQGQDLLVLGYPGAVKSSEVSVTRGIVSAVRRGWVQTDAAIDHGNSGGPAIDSQGRVIGLATFGVGTAGKIGGLVAIDAVREIARAAKIPGGPRSHRLSYPGWEYISPAFLAKRGVFFIGGTKGLNQEVTYEISELKEAYGAFLFTVTGKTNAGGTLSTTRFYVDNSGMIKLSQSEPYGKYIFARPLEVFPIPLRVGMQWPVEWAYQTSNALSTYRTVMSIETTDAVVTVPAGSYSHVAKLVSSVQMTAPGQQPKAWLVSSWYAAKVGLVHLTQVARDTQEQELDIQLVRAVY